MTAYASTETAVEALRQGAYDYVTKPFQTDEILARIGRIDQLQPWWQENRVLRRRIAGQRRPADRRQFAGHEAADQDHRAVAPGRVQRPDPGAQRHGQGTGGPCRPRGAAPGATGPSWPSTARPSPRPCWRANCSATARARSPGRTATTTGYFARADGGSLFLDDIDDLPLTVQVKLLRVIQEREIEPVGGGAQRAGGFPADLRHQGGPARTWPSRGSSARTSTTG